MFVDFFECIEHFSGIFCFSAAPREVGSGSTTTIPTVTHERILLMTAIHGCIKINWSRFLFDILKDMVTPSSKQAKGFAAQICVLLKGVPDLTLGESKTFPPLKILTVKIVGTYVAKHKSVSTTAEEVTDEQTVEKVFKATVKRITAPAAEPVAKRKRTTVGRAAPT
ncbi:hydrolase [Dorcoceras hygrometricum]|uniref:Hydrolase n=1 Tax=Dorcoceras hygrometricum TaxID=472368 RepID=A0A2Z7AP59_9LAMI|nr:hydrolase [Dorcoceras hygrometricum]